MQYVESVFDSTEVDTEVDMVVQSADAVVDSTESIVTVPADSLREESLIVLKQIRFDLLIIILLILAIFVFSVFRKSFLRVRGD